MCGIFGFIETANNIERGGASNGERTARHQKVEAVIQTGLSHLRHRGPDGQGVFVDRFARAGLGHTRLSIIGLESGAQPISNETNDVHIVVNGELYGYKEIREQLQRLGHVFKTESDSEIALHLYEEYGVSFVDQLCGEFAIIVWDERDATMIAVKDRFGVKPLFYNSDPSLFDGKIAFASEMKAFKAFETWQPEWDMHAIMHGIGLTGTLFKGIQRVPPAHYAIVTKSGGIQVKQYWEPSYPDDAIKEERTLEEMVAGTRERIVDAVRVRLVADVPVGVYLSGGIDSASVLGVATQLLREKDPKAKLRCFTISFKDGGFFDEAPVAERMAKFANAEYAPLSVSEQDIADNFEDCVYSCEREVYNGNAVGKYLLSRSVRDAGFKVVLTGEGSDEIFAGYSFFLADYLLKPCKSFPDESLSEQDRIKRRRVEVANGIGLTGATPDDAPKVSLAGVYEPPSDSVVLNGIRAPILSISYSALPENTFSQEVIDQYGKPHRAVNLATAFNHSSRSKMQTQWHPLHSALRFSHELLANFLLVCLGDRVEMAHSVEARVPFLDHRLVDYVNQLPPSLKIRFKSGEKIEKYILREAMKPFITEELYNRRKHPHLAPSSVERASPVNKLAKEIVTEDAVERLGFLDWKAVEALMQADSDGNQNKRLAIASLVTLQKRFNVRTFGA